MVGQRLVRHGIWLALFLLLVASAAADDLDALREDFLASINAERAGERVGALTLSQPLSRLAQELADELARRGERDLAEPPEGEMVARAEKMGYSVKSLTEIFTRADGSVPEVVGFWRKSGGRTWSSLLRADFRDLGVGASLLDDAPLYVFLLGISWDEYATERSAEYRDLAEMRRQMLSRINAERARRSLPPLATAWRRRTPTTC
jgi:uncharacterized protein YkwD